VSLAEERGVTPAQIAVSWLLHKPGVNAPIVGATKMAHLEEAVAAADITLSGEEMAALEEPYQPHSVRGHS
jgi:aryl-alcohol dehydrogenase (NADP+)